MLAAPPCRAAKRIATTVVYISSLRMSIHNVDGWQRAFQVVLHLTKGLRPAQRIVIRQ